MTSFPPDLISSPSISSSAADPCLPILIHRFLYPLLSTARSFHIPLPCLSPVSLRRRWKKLGKRSVIWMGFECNYVPTGCLIKRRMTRQLSLLSEERKGQASETG